jgi:hypothetical protein
VAERKPGLLTTILLFFVFLFFRPICWVADKIKGGGCGAGPAFASFTVAAFLVLGGVVALVAGILVGFFFLT